MIKGFHVMSKPIGPVCDLRCAYCFYLEKKNLFPENESFKMRDEVLEAHIQKYARSQLGPELTFAWQGGEPTLMGLDFFRKVVALQRSAAGGRTTRNTLQTNGTNLDDAWCEFFAREGFLIGLSLDGPQRVHDRYRVDARGHGSFEDVTRGMELLKKHGVEFNTLTCVTRESAAEGAEIYAFLKERGVKHMQFIPIVERVADRAAGAAASLAGPPELGRADEPVEMTPWSVTAEGYGRFLIDVFDEWIQRDVGRVFVNLFDVALGAWCGNEPGLCVFARTCGDAVALEHDGSVYACDHFVYPRYRLGNVLERSYEEMIFSKEQRRFGADKRDRLPRDCRECAFLFACNGECPKHRFISTADGEAGLNYLCAGYKTFFQHVDPAMREMARLVQNGRPASDIMDGAG